MVEVREPWLQSMAVVPQQVHSPSLVCGEGQGQDTRTRQLAAHLSEPFTVGFSTQGDRTPTHLDPADSRPLSSRGPQCLFQSSMCLHLKDTFSLHSSSCGPCDFLMMVPLLRFLFPLFLSCLLVSILVT